MQGIGQRCLFQEFIEGYGNRSSAMYSVTVTELQQVRNVLRNRAEIPVVGGSCFRGNIYRHKSQGAYFTVVFFSEFLPLLDSAKS